MTAQVLADEFELSTRTIYRDIMELQYQNIPINGATGIGYTLDKSYNLPPLTLSSEELETMVLAVHWLAQQGDPGLRQNAKSLLSKIQSVISDDLHDVFHAPRLLVFSEKNYPDQHLSLKKMRDWIRQEKKCWIEYRKNADETLLRKIWPVALIYFESSRLLVAWCETRQAFRHFRSDRIIQIDFVEESIPFPNHQLLSQWRQIETCKGYDLYFPNTSLSEDSLKTAQEKEE